VRKEFELTANELETLLDACKPTPVMYLPGGQRMFDSPQENANRAWKALGKKHGFDGMTVRPISDKSDRFFTAEVLVDPPEPAP
jgi:hypothetical protein